MNSWQAPFSLPPVEPPVSIIESTTPIPLFEEFHLYSNLIIDPEYDPLIYIDPELPSNNSSYQLAYSRLVTNIINTAISGRIPEVDRKGRLVLRKRIPERVTNYHHIFYRHNVRNGTLQNYPLIDILEEFVNTIDPYTNNPVWTEEDVVINMMRLERVFHMRIHGGRKKLDFIKTKEGNIPTNELLFSFSLFNLVDRKAKIVAMLMQTPYWHMSSHIKRAMWYLDVAENMANKVAVERPDLFNVWVDYIDYYSDVYEQ